MGKTILLGVLFLIFASASVSADTSLRCRYHQRFLSKLESVPELRLVGWSNEEVWNLFFASRSNEYRNLLVERYRQLVRYQANAIAARLSEEVDVEDLESEGIFGLMDAIDAFDPDRKVKFETFAPPRIRGAILDYLRKIDIIPRLVRSRSKAMDEIRESFRKEFGREPSDDEILDRLVELRGSTEEAEKIFKDSHVIKIDSMNRQLNANLEGTNTETEGHQFLADPSQVDPLASVENDEGWQILLKGFTNAERIILILRYKEGMRLKEIGKVLDLSEGRVSQMHTSILERLKSRGEEWLRFLLTAE